ncbi:MAG: hypothetical protein K0S08_1579 [Gammaproteobacteria bacterium]|nr:hypothetical protein [Gammaproteobacteria bacterium]
MRKFFKKIKKHISSLAVTAGSIAITAVFGCGKVLQSVGQALFSAGLDDEGLGLPAEANKAMDYTAMAGSFIVAIFSRIPKMYTNSKHLLACQKPKQNLTEISAAQNLPTIRKAVYKTSFVYFIFSGICSAIFTTLNAIQAGVILARKIISKPVDSNLPPTWPEYVGATFVPACSFYSYATFNLTRIFTNSRTAALTVASIGSNHTTLSRREKLSLIAAGFLAVLYTIGNAALAVISTEGAIIEINQLFFNLPINPRLVQAIGLASAIPGLASVLLTAGADLYKIFTGALTLVNVKSFRSSAFRICLATTLALASAADSLLNNGAGFFGSMLMLLNRWFSLSQQSPIAKGIAGSLAILSIPPYFANNGAQAFQVIQSAFNKPALSPPSESAENLSIDEENQKKQLLPQGEIKSGFWAKRQRPSHITIKVEPQAELALPTKASTSYGTLTARTPRSAQEKFKTRLPSPG